MRSAISCCRRHRIGLPGRSGAALARITAAWSRHHLRPRRRKQMDWRTKGMLQKVLGVMPGGAAVHYQLQRRFGGLRDFDREFDIKIDDWRLMANQLREVGVPVAGARLFEIGSGWYPTFPLCCFLAGARRGVPVAEVRQRQQQLAGALERSADLAVATAGVVDYRAPADAARTGLPPDRID